MLIKDKALTFDSIKGLTDINITFAKYNYLCTWNAQKLKPTLDPFSPDKIQ